MADPTPDDLVRFLVNDPLPESGVDTGCVFSDAEIAGYLTLEGGAVKRAAAQAIDTIADNEALTSKYIRDHQLTLDGTKVADSLRKRATSLRAQADAEEQAADDGFFELIGPGGCRPPELTEHPVPGFGWLG